MTPVKATLPLLMCALALAGCGSLGDEAYQRSVDRDWQKFKSMDYVSGFRRLTGLDELAPTQAEREAAEGREICFHRNGQNRVVSQNGIEDHTTYRRCAASPYPSETGVRLFDRPEG